eukprot:scaffold154588_cov18-Tisochrysis_lutea.AAC.1
MIWRRKWAHDKLESKGEGYTALPACCAAEMVTGSVTGYRNRRPTVEMTDCFTIIYKETYAGKDTEAMDNLVCEVL